MSCQYAMNTENKTNKTNKTNTAEKKIKPSNILKIRGTIIGIRSSSKMTSLIIISDGGKVKGSTVSNVVFYGPVKDSFGIHEHVDITAHMQSRIIRSENTKRSFRQYVIGDEIKRTNRLLSQYIRQTEFQTPDGGIPDDVNKAFVCGKVTHIYQPKDDYAVITILVPSENEKMNYVDVTCYNRQAAMVSRLEEDDFVVCAGELRSAKERPKPGEYFWQNILCKDIEKIPVEKFDDSSYIN